MRASKSGEKGLRPLLSLGGSIMRVLALQRPYGHLVYSGEISRLLVSSPAFDRGTYVIGNTDNAWPESAAWALKLEADGVSLGRTLSSRGAVLQESQTNFPIALLAVVDVEDVTRFNTSSLTEEDILRATALSIDSRTRAEVVALYGQDRLQYALHLSNVRPLSTLLTFQGLADASHGDVIDLGLRDKEVAIVQRVGTALTLSDPTLV